MMKLYNADCLPAMREMGDNEFELAICDPPFGIGQDWKKRKHSATKYSDNYKNDSIPPEEYFEQLRRIAKNWIVWGCNYFGSHFFPTNYLIVWDKCSSEETSFYSKCELAATNVKTPFNIVRIPWDGGRKGIETGIQKTHPHQKPVALYRWLLENYAKPGDKIFDSHIGSGSIACACHDMGFDLVGYELDKDYYEAACKRLREHESQIRMF